MAVVFTVLLMNNKDLEVSTAFVLLSTIAFTKNVGVRTPTRRIATALASVDINNWATKHVAPVQPRVCMYVCMYV